MEKLARPSAVQADKCKLFQHLLAVSDCWKRLLSDSRLSSQDEGVSPAACTSRRKRRSHLPSLQARVDIRAMLVACVVFPDSA